jgi:hypothetical protein
MHGLEAARQTGEYMLAIPNVGPTTRIDVALDGSNAGRLSPASHNLVRPVLSGIAENLSLAALRRWGRRAPQRGQRTSRVRSRSPTPASSSPKPSSATCQTS